MEIFVTNWFTKKKEYPSKDCNAIKEKIKSEMLSKCAGKQLKEFTSVVAEVLKETEDLKKIPSDTRLPVCSLYHHLCTTSAVAVCLAMDMEEVEITEIRLASLLHDIGKLDVFANNLGFSEHPEYTAKFVEDLLRDAKIPGLEIGGIHRIKNLAARHHTPKYYGSWRAQQPLEKLISLADTIASAVDRTYEVRLKDNMLESQDRIFPHVFRGRGKEEVLRYGEGVSTNEIEKERIGKESVFFDEVVHGGLTGESYPLDEELKKIKMGLLFLDIMQIQDFIKEAKKLDALTGGSVIIEDVQEIAKKVIGKSVCAECVLYAGGGNVLAVLPTKKLSEIKESITEKIKGEYGEYIKFVIVHKEFECSKFMDNFHECVKELHEEAEREKGLLASESEVRRMKSSEICEYCHKRGGQAVQQTGEILCEICRRKEEEGRQWWGEDEFHKSLIALGVGNLSKELDNIGQNIAVLIFDGNMIGRLFKNTYTPADYKFKSEEFDMKINRILTDTAIESVKEKKDFFLHKDSSGGKYIGIRKIYIGGDDILIVMNAKGALHFATKFIENICENFTFKFGEFTYPVVTMSCGIAYAPNDFPIYFLIEKAEALLSEAKKEFRKKTVKEAHGFFKLPKGAIALSCITSSMPVEEDFCFVLDNDKDKLNLIMEFVEHAQDKNWKSLVSQLINFEDGFEGRINFIKFLYSHMEKERVSRCASERRVEVVEKLIKATEQKNVLEYLIPMVWGEQE
ncbi:MAG: Cas10/Cmr2 second palm domain-containing protein [Thermoplasmata archaeon]